MPATKPRILFGNDLANDSYTLVASSSEIALQPSQALLGEKEVRWESNHTSFVIVVSQNDRLDYNIGAGAILITLTAGQYRGANLAAHIQSLLGAAFTVTYSTSTSKFTLVKASGTFSMLHSSGANRSRSVSNTIGFDSSADDTAALTYTSDFVTTSTWGRFIIDSTNKVLVLDATTITLTEATYSAKTLATHMINAIDAGMAGADDFDVQFDEATFKWKLKRQGSGVTLAWSSATTTIEGTLGYAAVDDVLGAGVYSTADTVACMTSEELDIDRLTATPGALSFVGLSANVSSAAIVSVQAGAAADYSGLTEDQALTYNSKVMYYFPAAPSFLNKRHFRIKIVDPTNTNGYVGIGALTGVPSTSYFTTSRYAKSSPVMGKDRSTYVSQSDGKNRRGTINAETAHRDFAFKGLSLTDYNNFEALFDAVADAIPFWAVMDLDNNPYTETDVYYLEGNPLPQERPVMNTFDMNLPLRGSK